MGKKSLFLKWFLIISRFCFLLALLFNLISIVTYIVQAAERSGNEEYINKVFYTSLLTIQSIAMIFISSYFLKVIRNWANKEKLIESLQKAARGLIFLTFLQGLTLGVGILLNISYQQASSEYMNSAHWSVPFVDFVQSWPSLLSIFLRFVDPTPFGVLALICALFIFSIVDRLETRMD